jgi:hypothetical protein
MVIRRSGRQNKREQKKVKGYPTMLLKKNKLKVLSNDVDEKKGS